MSFVPVLETSLAYWPLRRGKVRDVYDLGERLLIVSSDRISAFDWILPTPIPDKGRVLTQLSRFWFETINQPHHLLSMSLDELPELSAAERQLLAGRSMIVRKAVVTPIECVVRGYLAGSGWKEYQQSGTVCGVRLPAGLRQADRLPEPIFTPATKEDSGHDINISFEQMVQITGRAVAEELRSRSLAVYERGAQYALDRGIIIADTKFEWGRAGDQFILVDEVLTPDSSRFWPADQYQSGGSPPSFDKQFVRDWLETTDWDKNSPPPALPDDVAQRTRQKYIEAFERLTGQAFDRP